MQWHEIKLPAGTKLFKVHSFAFMHASGVFHLEVDEFPDGTCSGHGEHSTDKSHVIESVSGSSVSECLIKLIQKIQSREGS